MRARLIGLVALGSLVALVAHVHAASVSLAWDYTGSGYTNFQVHRCVASALTLDCVPTADLGMPLPITQKMYMDTTVLEGARYCWNVVSTKTGIAASVPTNTVCQSIPVVVNGGPSNLRKVE